MKSYQYKETLLFTIIGIASAIVCTGYARLFAFAEHSSLVFYQHNPLLSFLMAPAAMLLSFLLVWFLAPGAAGSGIPQVLACIEVREENLLKKFLRKSVISVKIISSLIGVFAGAAVGREGPSLQISAAIAYNAGKFSERFGIRMRLEQLLVAGAAGGLSAAFNTPIGGVVFAIEELSKEHVRNFRDVLLLSVIIAGLGAQLINGHYLFLGYPEVAKDYSFWALGLIVLCSLISGIAGGLFSKILFRVIRWRAGKKLLTQLAIVATAGLIFAATFYYLGERNLYSGKESINVVLFGTGTLPWYEVFTRFFMPLLSSMTGIAGGVFAPALSAGAVIGGTLAELLDPSLMVILGFAGMVGFLTGVTHTPITSFILVLEMSDRHGVVFPMMIAALCSSIGAHMISHQSFYEETVEEIKRKLKLSQGIPSEEDKLKKD